MKFLVDMDGVIYHGSSLLPGAHEFITFLQNSNIPFLFITNSSDKTPQMLQKKLSNFGLHVNIENFYTSALCTAKFLSSQKPNGSAYVIGGAGINQALLDVGYTIHSQTESSPPDYVVVGEIYDDSGYNYSTIKTAINHVMNGSFLIGTNVDNIDNSDFGYAPATGALLAPIQVATGIQPYFLGKPNPLMMNYCVDLLGGDRNDIIIIGDRMDTDIIGGIQSGISTVLVMSGVTTESDLKKYSFKPSFVMAGVHEYLEYLQKIIIN